MDIDCQKYYEAEGELLCPPRDLVRFKKTAAHVYPAGSLLDVGCREGDWLAYLHERASRLEIFACDIAVDRAERAGKKNRLASVVAADGRQLPFAAGSFDQVTCMEVLEHISEWQVVFAELMRVAKERVVITVPYAEKLASDKCQKCGTESPLYGHINSFSERDFINRLNGSHSITFERFGPPMKLSHYVQRVMSGVAGAAARIVPEKWSTLCPNCYEKTPYSKRRVVERTIQRVRRQITRTPEHCSASPLSDRKAGAAQHIKNFSLSLLHLLVC